MCVICKDWLLGKITTKEAWRNLQEMANTGNNSDDDLVHYWEVAEKLAKEQNENLED